MNILKYAKSAFQSNILGFGWSEELPLTSMVVGRFFCVHVFENVPLVEEAQNEFIFFLNKEIEIIKALSKFN